MAETLKEAFLQQRIDELERELSYAYTAMRNALVDIEDDDIDSAKSTLTNLVGDN